MHWDALPETCADMHVHVVELLRDVHEHLLLRVAVRAVRNAEVVLPKTAVEGRIDNVGLLGPAGAGRASGAHICVIVDVQEGCFASLLLSRYLDSGREANVPAWSVLALRIGHPRQQARTMNYVRPTTL